MAATLPMYVIYDHPRDYPDEFVCRRAFPWAGCVAFEATLFARAESLEAIRASVPPGLYRLPRDRSDDPVIVETWF